MTTVERILRDWRPSTLAASCPSAVSVVPAAEAYVLGSPAVAIQLRTAPTFGLHATTSTNSKINNSMNMTTSHLQEQKVSAQRVQTVAGDKVKGGDARGIPPRGRPV